MYCRICGKQLPDTSAFCFNCGTPQSAPVPEAAPLAPTVAEPVTEAAPVPEAAPLASTVTVPIAEAVNPAFIPAEPAPPTTTQTTQSFLHDAAPASVQKKARRTNIPALILAAVSVLLAAALLLSFLNILPSPFGTSATASGLAVASRSFDTPEEAIESFVEYLKAGDYNGALSTCAIDAMAKGYNYQKFVERMSAIIPMQNSGMPSEYEPYVTYNAAKNAGLVLSQMIGFTVSFSLSEENRNLIDGTTNPLENGTFPDGLMDELDPSLISSLKIVKIDKTAVDDTQINRKNQKEQAAIYGADDLQFRAVLYQFNGDYYVGGFTLVEYDGKWQIQNMLDPIIGIPYSGVPIAVSDKSEFEDMLE